MSPAEVKKLDNLEKEGLLHAAIMDQKNQDADMELESVRGNLKRWLREHQRGHTGK